MTDQDKTSIMETIMRDQERRFVMNNIAKSATVETQGGRPRICRVLGGKEHPLEVGEAFDVEGFEDVGPFYINEDGEMVYSFGDADMVSDDAIYVAISHPDRIIRKPHFTKEEIADLSTLRRIIGIEYIARDDGGDLWGYTGQPQKWEILGQ